MENQYLRTELSTADRAKSLAIFQTASPSKTIAAHVIGNTTGLGAKVVIIDRGTTAACEKGMAVITPDGIVGKVIGVYPTASYVLLITDPSFAAGVISQKNRVHGTLKGQGHNTVIVDYVQNEQTVEQGEWFYTSGDDRIFPKGPAVGKPTWSAQANRDKEIFVTPSGLQNGLEEVLIIVEGVHGQDSRGLASAIKPCICRTPAPPRINATADTAPAAADRWPPTPTAWWTTTARSARPEKHVYGAGAAAPRTTTSKLDADPGTPRSALSTPASRGISRPSQNRAAAMALRDQSPRRLRIERSFQWRIEFTSRRSSASRWPRFCSRFTFRASVTALSYLELPLLVTVYFSLMPRSPVAGRPVRRGHRPGAGFAFAQSPGHVRNRQDAGGLLRRVGQPALRRGEHARASPGAGVLLLFFHQFFYWVLARALLGEALVRSGAADPGGGRS